MKRAYRLNCGRCGKKTCYVLMDNEAEIKVVCPECWGVFD